MPVYSLEELIQEETLLGMSERVRASSPGLVLFTGQARSGKLTTLAALALTLAGDAKPVAVLSDRPDQFRPFEPLPASWRLIAVDGSEDGWTASLRKDEVARASVVIINSLIRDNAAAIFGMRRD